MPTSTRSRDYQLFLNHLRDARDSADMTQVQLAESLSRTQSYVSKVERGERRLDVIELRQWVAALGGQTVAFVVELEALLERNLGPDDKAARRRRS